MKTYVAIDDTDNLEVGATGQSANELRRMIHEQGWGQAEPVTRHQLLLHPDVPYTSHNSSMCFIAELKEERLNDLIKAASEFLEKTSAPGSDPGLGVAVYDQIREKKHLLAYGVKTKNVIVSKEEAYRTAKKCSIHLSEHGGTGIGVIGALAGIALRMTGNDGRFQGRMKLGEEGQKMSAGEVLANSEIEAVQSIDGYRLADDELLTLGDKIKTVLLDNQRKLLVYREKDGWRTCNNKQLKNY